MKVKESAGFTVVMTQPCLSKQEDEMSEAASWF